MSTNCRRVLWLVSTGFLAVPGCALTAHHLEPAASARKVAGLDRAAVQIQNQVEVLAQAHAWPGDDRVTESLEPLRVRIANYGARPVLVRYGHFRLQAGDGTVFQPIPPLTVRGAPVSRLSRAFITPRFSHSNYLVAPCYDHTFSGIGVYRGPFACDREYYELRAHRWGTTRLPTPEMLDWALPEGVLPAGGYVDGYLYFPRVSRDKDQLRFEATLKCGAARRAKPASRSIGVLQEAVAEAEVATISIPFTVN